MESYTLIKYKWDRGVYDLEKMKQLVQKNEITKEEFFEITRYTYIYEKV